ncbi:ABC transporter substrate-binding protein [Rhodovulum sp. DZ06]|uniref:ABC transporter substrate-binding protein n=1 Tax=Rhodovulum sp. DZ06 TaxID=3425126 RepID=UPI003D341CA5
MRIAYRKMLAALVCAGLGGQAAAQDAAQDTISIGLVLPMTGVYAVLGKEIEAGFKLGLEGYSDVGVNFTMALSDTAADVPTGVAVTREMIEERKVDVLVGLVSSAVLGNVRDMVHDARTPLIVANAGNDHATGKSCSPYVVRVSFSNAQVNRPMGTWLAQQGLKSAYLLAPDYAAGRQHVGAFRKTFEAAGGKVLGEDYTPFGKTDEFGPYLKKAWATGAEAVYVFYAGGEAIKFVKQYHALAKAEGEDAKLFGSGFLTSPLYSHVQGEAVEGVIVSSHYAPTISNASNRVFRRKWQRLTGREPSEFAVQGYDAARVLAEAVANGARGREGIAEALAHVKFSGPRGTIIVDEKTNNLAQPIYVYRNDRTADGKIDQKILAALPIEADAPNGCVMQR